MICPTLDDLPCPPAGKSGWPWTEESDRLADCTVRRRQPWPRISVITPSFNQGEFLEETIRSILLQGYPDLEYLVLDGGSRDGSVEMIKKYSRWISYWVSEPDGGQSEAINRGLKRASGEFATWINSDDLLCKNAFTGHASQVGFDNQTVYLGFCIYIDAEGEPVVVRRGRVFSLDDLLRVRTVWRSGGSIDQPAVLFPRSVALSVGGLNTRNHRTMDYELWGRFLLVGAKFQYTPIHFGMFRQHSLQKTHDGLRQTESLLDTAAKLVALTDFSEETKNNILADLNSYKSQFRKDYWRCTGRLARMGLPAPIVAPVRKLKSLLHNRFNSRAQ